MYGVLDISVSGMVAQRTRLESHAANIANQDAIENARGEYEPYLRRHVMLAKGDPTSRTEAGRDGGVHVAEIWQNPEALEPRYMPSSPHADEDGYVMGPNIDPLLEQAGAMEAFRAYEANVMASESTKSMISQALRMLA